MNVTQGQDSASAGTTSATAVRMTDLPRNFRLVWYLSVQSGGPIKFGTSAANAAAAKAYAVDDVIPPIECTNGSLYVIQTAAGDTFVPHANSK